MNEESLGTNFANWLYGIDLGIANNTATREDVAAMRRFAVSATFLSSHAQQAYIAFHNGTTIITERDKLISSINAPFLQN